ncbi:MAG: polysaccharide biosynthesis C-terminal domain-containing protein [Lentisphaeria bacterium]|nr:polysaccharide biosynthesis C-terminal domain-containing protein [Lentisphaeria bacterium]
MLKRLFKDRFFNQKLVTLAMPITLQNLMVALVAAADAFMLGKLNQDAMAAVSLATQVQFIQNCLVGAIVGGVGIMGAQYWGKKDIPVMEKIFGLSIRESTLVSLLFFAGCFFIPETLMKIFASDPLLIEIGAEYLRLASWSYIICSLSQCYLAIMRVSDHAGVSALISSGAVVLNIIFNTIFIFGLCGAPAMGVKGAAFATLLARAFELAGCLLFSAGKGFIRLRLKRIFTFEKELILDFWRYTSPLVGSYMLWGTGFTAYTAIMGHMGKDAAAANAIAAVVRDLCCCVCNGVAFGSSVIIGNELGAGKLLRGKIYGAKSALLAFIVGFAATGVILLSLPLVSRAVKLTPLAQEYLTGMFIILSVYMIGRCVCTVVINGIFSAGGDTLFDVYSLVVCMWGIALPCAFFGAFYLHLPVLVIYGCTCLDEVGKIPWVMFHYKKYKWVRNITR